MKFVIVLSRGDNPVECINGEVPGNNDFAEAAIECTRVLFSSTSADNVTGYREFESGTVAEDHFFYAEKE
jgi:hypothetical protein